jgi:hypothetical protein
MFEPSPLGDLNRKVPLTQQELKNIETLSDPPLFTFSTCELCNLWGYTAYKNLVPMHLWLLFLDNFEFLVTREYHDWFVLTVLSS